MSKLLPPDSIKKIVIYGPESVGKSTLAARLAAHYRTIWCPEFARGYLQVRNQLERRFEKGIVSIYSDIEQIAIGQMSTEDALLPQANQILFCDTDLLTSQLYSLHYFGKCPDWMPAEVARRRYDLHLLLHIDVPWIADGQRDRPEQREEMFEWFKKGLIESGRRYVEIRGSYEERFQQAVEAISTTDLLSFKK